MFARHGIPQEVVSDNGPQYASQEFAQFAQEYDFHHTTSSPHFPQSNGQAERGVQTVKKLLTGPKDPFMSLLTSRATPLPWCNLSPAELLMGRTIRSNIPQLIETLTPQWPYLNEFRQRNSEQKQRITTPITKQSHCLRFQKIPKFGLILAIIAHVDVFYPQILYSRDP